MRKRTVYIETSVPSFYYETRPEPAMQARREWTRQWWARAHANYELVTSEAVLDELERGDYATKADCVALVQSLPVLPMLEPQTSFPRTFGTSSCRVIRQATRCTSRLPVSTNAISC